ncbi:class I SAM-dependent methyltransferase [Desulfosediminicola flagellatus]|uniref:class I SAM-dependent methyltransferase n=1 Tax=Desulfosediminicola flagellatus TaxID=2569541 RepID=UPI0010ACCD21|nr:methyltransferase domain-containing protein [Desulfosediminicola flagellatus]
MPKIRSGRQKYYNVFAYFYDFFIQIHSGRHREETRRFLVESVGIEKKKHLRILDICCGTGSVVLAFAEKYADALAVGYDFSTGMLHKAKHKDKASRIVLVQGDAAYLSFNDDCFDVVCCSHALYELKGQDRTGALWEMKRVVKSDGQVLIMEHQIPKHPIIKILFYIRMLMMGPTDSREFLQQGLTPFERIFPDVSLSHTPSGKSKLIRCRKTTGDNRLRTQKI